MNSRRSHARSPGQHECQSSDRSHHSEKTELEMPIAATSSRRRPIAQLPRSIVLRTRGHSHGPITRLVSPGDLGELIKPFVFLDYFDADPANAPKFGFRPHSGIATLTLIFSGQA